MPHLRLEYTANLETRAPDRGLFSDLHGILHELTGVAVENCKSRWNRVENWMVGDEKPDAAFVHLQVRYLEGRTPEVAEKVGREALRLLSQRFSPSPEQVDLQITVEIGEIRRSHYFKEPTGTLSPPPAKEV